MVRSGPSPTDVAVSRPVQLAMTTDLRLAEGLKWASFRHQCWRRWRRWRCRSSRDLIFRRRSRPVDLGTLRFLKIAVRRDTRRRRLKRWVLLALRVGCVVLAVLVFARPYRAETLGGGDTGLTVILIDRSASMERQRDGERLVDRAVRELPEVVGRIPTRSRVEVAWFDSKVERVGTAADGRVSLSDLKAPANLSAGTDFAAALTWAAVALRSRPRRRAARRSRHHRPAAHGVRQPGHVLLPEGRAGSRVGCRRRRRPRTSPSPRSARRSLMVRADSADHRAGDRVELPAAAAQPAAGAAATRATRGRPSRSPALPPRGPEASTTVTFETPPLGPGLWQGTVSVVGGRRVVTR